MSEWQSIEDPGAWMESRCDRSPLRFHMVWACVGAITFSIIAMFGLGAVLFGSAMLGLDLFGQATLGCLVLLGLVLAASLATRTAPLGFEWRSAARQARQDTQLQCIVALEPHRQRSSAIALREWRRGWQLRVPMASGGRLELRVDEGVHALYVSLALLHIPVRGVSLPPSLDALLEGELDVRRTAHGDTLDVHIEGGRIEGELQERIRAASRGPAAHTPRDPACRLARALERLMHALEGRPPRQVERPERRLTLLSRDEHSDVLHWRPRRLELELDGGSPQLDAPPGSGGWLFSAAQGLGLMGYLALAAAATTVLLNAPLAPQTEVTTASQTLLYRGLFCALCLVPGFFLGRPRLRLGRPLRVRYAPVRGHLVLHEHALVLEPKGLTIDLMQPFTLELTQSPVQSEIPELGLELWQMEGLQRKHIRVRCGAVPNPALRALPEVESRAPRCSARDLGDLWPVLCHYRAAQGEKTLAGLVLTHDSDEELAQAC